MLPRSASSKVSQMSDGTGTPNWKGVGAEGVGVAIGKECSPGRGWPTEAILSEQAEIPRGCGLEMVQNSEWGPRLWRVLHTLAERLGRQGVPLLAMDEVRAWIFLLRETGEVMPCALCRKHYKEWRKEHPLDAFLETRGGGLLQQRARSWLWSLHEAVNRRREMAGVAEEDVPALYASSAGLQADVEALVKLFQQAVLERQIDGGALREWRARLTMVRRLVGV